MLNPSVLLYSGVSDRNTRIADISRIFRVYCRSKVQIPRSHKIKLGLPAAKELPTKKYPIVV
ncbi:hypothetical protein H6G96_14500 [Nostoc sp. FACHB-892]|uniref:hypothetical protein n=1 Tax=Nostoc sp. FACHB-892 TaxID=2692843 RepID=UPI0016890023|nr:hypothetical protein [Nostoc sp. FACHB-892]MBD2727505.1 hypothetical protein [Nostoc sp. FACHB-892]